MFPKGSVVSVRSEKHGLEFASRTVGPVPRGPPRRAAIVGAKDRIAPVVVVRALDGAVL